jgi:mRNA interferase RelE/StbE
LSYRVDVRREVVRALKRLPADDVRRIASAIDDLAETPRPSNAKKLRGGLGWRVRVGEYRLIYLIFDREQLVTVEQLERRTTHTYD